MDQENQCPEEDIFRSLRQNPKWQAKPGRVFYLSRHGESLNNKEGKIGGNAGLSGQGHQYGKQLAQFFNSQDLDGFQVSTTLYYVS